MKRNIVTCCSLLLLFMGLSQQLHAQTQAQKDSLNALGHQFDFWLGEWDVYKNGTDTIVGDSFIESILDSTAIQEHYKAVGSAYTGTSLNKYNFLEKRWEQYWIDNSGLSLHLKGGIENGSMVMGNEMQYPKGKVNNKITWSLNDDGTVRQVWEQSYDGGEKWNVVFDGLYKPKVKKEEKVIEETILEIDSK